MSVFEYKYKKYKKKYLELITKQKKIEMMGGDCSTCPKLGFAQHFGECWHDAYVTLLLYTDGIGEHIQKIFDDPAFDIEKIMNYAFTYAPKKLIPYNIDEEDYDIFKKYSGDYILKLRNMYMNDKRNIIKKQTKTGKNIIIGQPRYDMVDESLSCVLNINNILNINAYIKKQFKAGTTGEEINTILQIVNLFLLQYEQTENKIIINTILNDRTDLTKIENAVEIANGISISVFADNYDYNIPSVAHQQLFFKCNNEFYIYDNNGANKMLSEDGYNFSLITNNEKELAKITKSIQKYTSFKESQNEPDESKSHMFSSSATERAIKYNWKKFLLDKLKNKRGNLEETLSKENKTDMDLPYLQHMKITQMHIPSIQELTDIVLDKYVLNYAIMMENYGMMFSNKNIIELIYSVIQSLSSQHIPDANKQIIQYNIFPSLVKRYISSCMYHNKMQNICMLIDRLYDNAVFKNMIDDIFNKLLTTEYHGKRLNILKTIKKYNLFSRENYIMCTFIKQYCENNPTDPDIVELASFC
jgi:hypothetical protein